MSAPTPETVDVLPRLTEVRRLLDAAASELGFLVGLDVVCAAEIRYAVGDQVSAVEAAARALNRAVTVLVDDADVEDAAYAGVVELARPAPTAG